MSGTVCLNCNHNNLPENLFCANCGQKINIHRISWHEITHDAIHYFTHADKSIFHLLGKLLSKPGIVAREYLAGKRTSYFKPLNFYLLVAAVLVFMTSFFLAEPVQSRRPRTGPAGSTEISESQSEEKRAIFKRSEKVNRFIGKYSNVVNMVAMPAFTFFLFLFYYKGPYNYTEHLVSNMYFVGFIMLFYSLVTVPLRYFIKNPWISLAVLGVFFVFEILYRGIAYYQLMNRKGNKYLFKAIGVSLLLSFIWVVTVMLFVGYYIRYGF